MSAKKGEALVFGTDAVLEIAVQPEELPPGHAWPAWHYSGPPPEGELIWEEYDSGDPNDLWSIRAVGRVYPDGRIEYFDPKRKP